MSRLIPENDLYTLLNRGISQSEIARIYNVSRQAVSARLKYRTKRKYPYIEARQFSIILLRRMGFLIKEISKLTGYTNVHVRVIIKRYGFETTENYYEERFTRSNWKHRRFSILFLYRIGFTLQEISVMTNYSFYTVRSYLYRSGYSVKWRS